MPGGLDAESLLRSLMDNIPGAIYRCANDGAWTVRTINDEIEAITGYPAADFADGSKLVEITHPDDRERIDGEVEAALASDSAWVLEFRIVHADGSVRFVHERGRKTVDRDGSEWIDGIIFDVTERRAAEQLRAERELEALRGAGSSATCTTAPSSAWWSRRCCCGRPRTPPIPRHRPRRRCARPAWSSTPG